MSTSSTAFTGSSQFSADFQAVVTRTVGIASLPMTQMNNVLNDLGARSSGLSSLDKTVGALQSAITTLSSSLGDSSYAASVSDYTILSASTSSGVSKGTFSIEVTDLGSVASTTSKASGPGIQNVTDPATQSINTDGTFVLTLNGGTPITITPASKTLNALAAAINQNAPGFQATVVNLGSTNSPSYRLSIQSTQYGSNTIQLTDIAGDDLIDPSATGSPVKYKPNGGAEVTSTTRSATLTPGLTVNLLKTSATSVASTVTVTRNTSAVSTALTSFVSAYNGVMTELSTSRGSGTGNLKGDAILADVSDALHQISGYTTGNSGLSSLTALGLTFDKTTFQLTFDKTAFNTATSSSIDALSSFLGTPTGGGFLKSATDIMNGLEDSSTGILKADISSVQKQITAQNNKIANEQDRIDRLTTDIQTRMAAADALISAMEQQAGFYTNMFQAMTDASKSMNA